MTGALPTHSLWFPSTLGRKPRPSARQWWPQSTHHLHLTHRAPDPPRSSWCSPKHVPQTLALLCPLPGMSCDSINQVLPSLGIPLCCPLEYPQTLPFLEPSPDPKELGAFMCSLPPPSYLCLSLSGFLAATLMLVGWERGVTRAEATGKGVSKQ